MPPSVDVWFVAVSNDTDGMGPFPAFWMYSAVNLRKKLYVTNVKHVHCGADFQSIRFADWLLGQLFAYGGPSFLCAQLHVVRLGWFYPHVEIASIMFFMIATVAAWFEGI